MRDYEDIFPDIPTIGDVVLLRTGSSNVQNRMTDLGYRGFLLPTSVPGYETSSPKLMRRWSGPKDPHAVGLILDVLDGRGIVRGKRILVLWNGEILEGRIDDFIPIHRTGIT